MSTAAANISLVRVFNPLHPSRDCFIEEKPWEMMRSVVDLVPEVIEGDFVVSMDGMVIDKDDYHQTYPGSGSQLVVVPVLHGGGGGSKSILRIAAFIALAWFAPWAAGQMGSWALAAGGGLSFAGTVVAAGITMAGAMLINALLPVEMPKQDSIDNTPTYGYDGPKNLSRIGIPVPIVYGKYRIAGNVIGMFTRNVTVEEQDLYVLINAGEGPIAGISDILINDQPLDSYNDLYTEIRSGESSQSPIRWFDDTVTPVNKGIVLQQSVFTTHTTAGDIDKFRLDFIFPAGLFRVTSKGKYRSKTCTLQVEYKLTSSGNWLPAGAVSSKSNEYIINDFEYHDGSGNLVQVSGSVNSSLPAGYHLGSAEGSHSEALAYVTGLGVNTSEAIYHTASGVVCGYVREIEVRSNTKTYSNKWTRPARVSIESPVLPRGTYDIRVMRTDVEENGPKDFNQIQLVDVNEIDIKDVAYNNTALLAMRVRVTDQFNRLPKITYINLGKKIGTWNSTSSTWAFRSSSNPAWIVFDMLTNSRYGGGISSARIDFDAFVDWADFCDTNGYEFNGVIETQTNLWEAMRPVLRTGHADLIIVGTKYSVVMERQDTPTMIFSVSNIIKNSFGIDWLPMDERANVIEATYFDRDNDYKRTEIKLYDESFDETMPEKVANVTLVGVTDRTRALKEARLHLNLNKYVTQTCTFDAPLEAIACTVGDLIYVQHDMPQWAYGGRLESGSTTSVLNLDRPVTMSAGKSYAVLVHYSTLSRYTGSVTTVNSAKELSVTGFDNLKTVKRIVINGTLELEVKATAVNKVYVESTAGINPTDTYELFDTDAIEERNVVLNVGEVTTVTLSSVLPAVPATYSNWMFGEVTKLKKPFRVKAITGDSDFTRTLTCLEYNDSVYDETVPATDTPNFSALDHVVRHAVIDAVTEDYIQSAFGVTTRVTVHFTGQHEMYSGSTVYVSVDGEPEYVLGSSRNTVSGLFDVGSSVVFRAVSYDIMGSTAPHDSAPTITHVVTGQDGAPPTPTGLNATATFNSVEITWTPPVYDNHSHTQVWRHTSDDRASATMIGTTNASVYVDSSVTTNTAYFYWIKHVSTSEIDSAYNALNGVSATTGQIATNDLADFAITTGKLADLSVDVNKIIDGSVSTSKFSTGIEPVSVQTSLPNPIGYTGPNTVYNSTDKKLYRYDSSVPEWKLAGVENFADMTGQVTGGQIASGAVDETHFSTGLEPVSIVSSLPNPVGYTGPNTVYNSTDKKLYRYDSSVPEWKLAGVEDFADMTGQVTGGQIANNAITETHFSTGLEPVSVVSALPNPVGYTGPVTVYNSTDKKIYRYDSSVPEWKLAGVENFADMNGTITSSQIGAGQVVTSHMTAGTIDAAVISAGTITGSLIQSGTITAGLIQSGTITATQIQAGTITGSLIQAGTITGSLIQAGTITGSLIEANTITGGLIQAGAITTSHMTAGTIDAAVLSAGTIVAGLIAAGAIEASHIAAASITSEKLVVSPSTLIPNGDFGTGDFTEWNQIDTPANSSVVPYNYGGVPAGADNPYVAMLTGAGANVSINSHSGTWSDLTGGIRVEEGEVYKISVKVAGDSPVGVTVFKVEARFVNANGTNASSNIIAGPMNTTGTWTTETGYVTIPANAVKMTVRVVAFHTSGELFVSNVRAVRASDASLIVDGSIVADKLAANAIAVGTAVIQNGAIVDAHIGSLSADKITAGTITATVGLQAANITGGSLDIGGGKFQVGTDGTIAMRGGPLGTIKSGVSITRTGSVATATLTAHGYSNNDYVFISGANQTEYNGIHQISNVAANTFDFTVTGTPATPATGTITAQLYGSGQRMEYSNDAIKVFDSAGVLRVQLGDLSA